ncbi:MAG: porin family protein [Bacteroidota bacterium]
MVIITAQFNPMPRILLFTWCFCAFAFSLEAQYWFGPKVGFHRTDYVYQAENFKSDSFNVKPNYNFQVGAVLTYQASDKYSVHTEINFERYRRELENFENDPQAISELNSGFLSVPFLLRLNFGRAPYLFYVNGGTKLSYWLYGNGVLENEFLQEAEDPSLDYTLAFRNDDNSDFSRLNLERPNRLQYALVAGGGVYFDLANESRIMLDVRYSFGHSNMGFNGSQDFDFDTYEENFEYRHFALSVSVGYMFEYNAQFQRKGKSTNKLSNKKRGG